jgi:hypothetical protein
VERDGHVVGLGHGRDLPRLRDPAGMRRVGLDDVDGIARFVSRFAKRGGPTPKGATQEESCKW